MHRIASRQLGIRQHSGRGRLRRGQTRSEYPHRRDSRRQNHQPKFAQRQDGHPEGGAHPQDAEPRECDQVPYFLDYKAIRLQGHGLINVKHMSIFC